ncbi:hypothetical protein EV424DRAFT_1352072 [Suillus variegatus]|nr:hypothetical protein EV424DRAFT_1352072 [Suillus variegatus]
MNASSIAAEFQQLEQYEVYDTIVRRLGVSAAVLYIWDFGQYSMVDVHTNPVNAMSCIHKLRHHWTFLVLNIEIILLQRLFALYDYSEGHVQRAVSGADLVSQNE